MLAKLMQDKNKKKFVVLYLPIADVKDAPLTNKGNGKNKRLAGTMGYLDNNIESLTVPEGHSIKISCDVILCPPKAGTSRVAIDVPSL